jgi:hypothetical protein
VRRTGRRIPIQKLKSIQQGELTDSLLPGVDVAEGYECVLVADAHLHPEHEVDVVDVFVDLQDVEVGAVGEVSADENVVDY